MANDRDNPDARTDDAQSKASDKGSDSGHKRVIGKGMTSPDSTQVPLRADTGEPDWDAIKGRVPKDADEDEDEANPQS
ncbi:MAG: hypothetical protein ACREPM_21815 [Gemmatimonadaceae bacterium]